MKADCGPDGGSAVLQRALLERSSPASGAAGGPTVDESAGGPKAGGGSRSRPRTVNGTSSSATPFVEVAALGGGISGETVESDRQGIVAGPVTTATWGDAARRRVALDELPNGAVHSVLLGAARWSGSTRRSFNAAVPRPTLMA